MNIDEYNARMFDKIFGVFQGNTRNLLSERPVEPREIVEPGRGISPAKEREIKRNLLPHIIEKMQADSVECASIIHDDAFFKAVQTGKNLESARISYFNKVASQYIENLYWEELIEEAQTYGVY